MTSKNSICFKCTHLECFYNAYSELTNGERYLLSDCIYGGVNAGNRKTCKRFVQAPDETIAEREKTLNRGIK